jgi:hypothetical protein
MPSLPQEINFESLTIKRSDIEKLTVLRRTQTHIVCRLVCEHGSYILKWFNSPTSEIEIQVYALLQKYDVRTLPVHKQTRQALLLEDLQNSSSWRLANHLDMRQAETGRAVAKWYRSLHRAGRNALKDNNDQIEFLRFWVSEITVQSLANAGAVFSLGDKRAWMIAIEDHETLKAKYLALPQTFNYNDFAAENLALSRGEDHPIQAVVFDYDCFSLGIPYSDWRNVVFSLRGAAKAAFAEVYGPISEKESLLDEPLDILYGIVIASRRVNTPNWVAPQLEAVATGRLERCIIKALEVKK